MTIKKTSLIKSVATLLVFSLIMINFQPLQALANNGETVIGSSSNHGEQREEVAEKPLDNKGELSGEPDIMGAFAGENLVDIDVYSKIQTQSIAPDWSEAEVVFAGDGEDVTLQFVAENSGNTELNDISLYSILPKNGLQTTDGKATVGTPFIKSIRADGGEIHYFLGYPLLPTIENIDMVNINDTGWTTTPPTSLNLVKAIYVNFPDTGINQTESHKVLIDYQMPRTSGTDITIYNQFAVKSVVGGESSIHISSSQAFTNNGYRLTYLAREAEDITNLPPNISGIFTNENWIDLTVSDQLPIKPQFRFVGWRDSATEIIYQRNEIIRLVRQGRNTIKLQAIFAPDYPREVTVIFHANGATSGVINPSTVISGQGEIISAPDISSLVRAGYRLSGSFFTTPNPTQGEESWDFSLPLPQQDIINLYVEWIEENLPINYSTVSFSVNGGNPAQKPDNIMVETGKQVGALPTGLTRAGYTHTGWSVNSSSLVADFNAETVVESDTIVYAVWKKISASITIVTHKYNYNESWQQAGEVDRLVVNLEPGASYKVEPLDIDKYVFMKEHSDKLDYNNINEEITVNLRYQHEIYSLKGITTLEIEAVNFGGSRTISARQLANLAEIKMYSNKHPRVVSLPRDAQLYSDDLAELKLTKLTQGYDTDIVLNCRWANGQESNLVIMVKITDTTPPTIGINSRQRVVFSQREALPKTEAELYNLLVKKGLVVSDNFDSNPKTEITYLDGGFSSISWQANEDYIIFINAADSSGNKLEFPRAVVISVES